MMRQDSEGAQEVLAESQNLVRKERHLQSEVEHVRRDVKKSEQMS